MKKYLAVSCLIGICSFFTDCARNPVTGRKQVVLMSEEQEIAMGKEADPQIIAQFGLYEDTAIQNFISSKGKQMAAISHRPKLEHSFRVLNSEVVNAFAVPGGYVYFTRGIMAHLNSEADFAGVLGHEIGHVAYRHSVAQQRNAIFAQLGIIAGIIISPDLAQFADVASTGLQLLLLKYGRDAERESDQLGVEYSTKIGYDARQMALFFRTLERQSAGTEGAELPEFLSTHPNPADRFVTVNKLADDWRKKLNLTTPLVNRNAYLRRIEGLVYGEDPREGYRENNMFYHPVLKFQFPIPANWNYQNTPQRVQMASKDGKALLMLMLGQGNSLQEAANTITQQYKLSTIESRNITVNGLPAIYLLADQQPQQQGQPALRTLSYIIQYNGTIYHLIGVSTITDFNNYGATFNNTMQAFRPLTDQVKLNKKPQRVRIRTVGSSITLSQFLAQHNVAGARLEEHAILNGMQLTDNLAQGTLVKIIAE
ncbi:MAG TPA: M48 family metalloprotease [Chitinophagaceae bacterium]|nr:M48 family metalloprotease [Chitinophagaceae bacterium]